MSTTDIRDEWQNEAKDKWIKTGGCGTVEAATGTGKTWLAFKCIKEYMSRYPDSIVHVIVPTKLLKDQWIALIPDNLTDNVSIWIINTYVKIPRKCDLIIPDEMHNYAAPSFVKVLDMSFTHILGLTATFKRKDGKHILLMSVAPLRYKLPIEVARKLGFVSDYQVYNLGVDFDPHSLECQEYRKAHNTFNGLFTFFDRDFKVLMKCVYGDYQVIDSIARQHDLTTEKVKGFTFACMNAMRKRKEILYEATAKLPILKEIINKLNLKTLVFTQTITSCEAIVDLIPNSITYHSGIKGYKPKKGKTITAAQAKRDILTSFENGTYDRLVGAKALNEGFSVNNVELAIFYAYTSDIRTFVQRMGRAVRWVDGKKATIIALYMKPFTGPDGSTIFSQELNWLKAAQKGDIGSIKWIDSVDEITNNKTISF
jgi:superfamily II DNA or RNA helicase